MANRKAQQDQAMEKLKQDARVERQAEAERQKAEVAELLKVNEAEAKEREEEFRKQNEESERQHKEGMENLQTKMDENNKVHEEKMTKMNKIIEQRNYARHVPEPGFLSKHKMDHPKSFYIQILGCRGAGKSTFVTKFLRLAQGSNSKAAKRGSVECTLKTEFFDITDCIDDLGLGVITAKKAIKS